MDCPFDSMASFKMDNDFGSESSESIQTTNKPKKRRTSLFGKQSNGSANAIPDSTGAALDSSIPQSGSRPRRLANWADDTTDGSQKIRSIQSTDSLSKANKQKLIDSSDSEDVAPMIPDLEEVNDYQMTQQVAEAPSAHNQIISFQELDKNLLKQSAFTSLDGTDLTQLTIFCLPESQVKEEDIAWSWDHLMSDITSKLLISDTESNIQF